MAAGPLLKRRGDRGDWYMSHPQFEAITGVHARLLSRAAVRFADLLILGTVSPGVRPDRSGLTPGFMPPSAPRTVDGCFKLGVRPCCAHSSSSDAGRCRKKTSSLIRRHDSFPRCAEPSHSITRLERDHLATAGDTKRDHGRAIQRRRPWL